MNENMRSDYKTQRALTEYSESQGEQREAKVSERVSRESERQWALSHWSERAARENSVRLPDVVNIQVNVPVNVSLWSLLDRGTTLWGKCHGWQEHRHWYDAIKTWYFK